MIAENAGGLLLKLHHGLVGVPDRLLLMPQHPARLAEFKRPGETLTSIQAHWARTLGRMGHPIMVFDSVEDFRRAIERGS